MNTLMTPWIDLTLHQAQRWHHLVWFLYGWAEREHLLNMDAFAGWLRGGRHGCKSGGDVDQMAATKRFGSAPAEQAL